LKIAIAGNTVKIWHGGEKAASSSKMIPMIEK
jgi:hypothetical protein